jgi:hypothetical protein
VTFDPATIQNIIVSHAEKLGLFDRVNAHEPKNAPGNGLSAAVWADQIVPVQSSGLDSTTIRVSYSIRVYQNMVKEPQDDIDAVVLAGVAALMTAYSGDFTLGDNAREVDLLGAHGVPLAAQSGYLNQDGRLYRVMTITLPIIFNDVFEQVA